MKRVLEFETEEKYLNWESKEGNTIYCLHDFEGNYVGDIREEFLVPMWDSQEIISIENPNGKYEEFIGTLVNNKCENWVVLPTFLDKVKELVVTIRIIKKR